MQVLSGETKTGAGSGVGTSTTVTGCADSSLVPPVVFCRAVTVCPATTATPMGTHSVPPLILAELPMLGPGDKQIDRGV
jgi:hypothetical protein